VYGPGKASLGATESGEETDEGTINKYLEGYGGESKVRGKIN